MHVLETRSVANQLLIFCVHISSTYPSGNDMYMKRFGMTAFNEGSVYELILMSDIGYARTL